MQIALVWLRRDLRIHDNLVLHAAQSKATHALPFYCLDTNELDLDFLFGSKTVPITPPTYQLASIPKTGIFRHKFLMESLSDLRKQLRVQQSDLLVLPGQPHEIISEIIQQVKLSGLPISGLFYQKEVSFEEIVTEKSVRDVLKQYSVAEKPIWGSTMYHVQDLPFQAKDCPDVFTEFRKNCETRSVVRPVVDVLVKPFPHNALGDLALRYPDKVIQKASHDSVGMDARVGTIPLVEQHNGSDILFTGGETSALERFHYYVWETNLVQSYKETRNGLLGMDYSSKLSPWLAYGCISPRYIYWEVKKYEEEVCSNQSTYWLIFELLWRDYWKIVTHRYGRGLYYLNGPSILRQQNYSRDWKRDPVLFTRWMRGQTGIPFVDAAMRELAQTGFMSNRSRQNVASFLVHSLGIDWRWGACYFESMLIDYDPESNYGNWQYVAGVGTDPREHRKFNMIKQAQDYDPEGEYVKHWCPELKHLPPKHPGLFMPWKFGLSYIKPVIVEKTWKIHTPKAKRSSDWKVKRFS